MKEKTIIRDKELGSVQFISSKEDVLEALREFDDAVGIDPHGGGLEKLVSNYTFEPISDYVEAKLSLRKSKDGSAFSVSESFVTLICSGVLFHLRLRDVLADFHWLYDGEDERGLSYPDKETYGHLEDVVRGAVVEQVRKHLGLCLNKPW
jgi:hypothetical protein